MISRDDVSAKKHNFMRFDYVKFMAFIAIEQVVILSFLYLTNILPVFHFPDFVKKNQIYPVDFVHFYMAGKLTLSPQRNQLYSWNVQKPILDSIASTNLPIEDFYTPYFPFIFLMMVPYCLLPINYAGLLFNIVNTLVGLSGYFSLAKCLSIDKNKMFQYILWGALASAFSWMTWLNGQVAWLYVGIVCLYLAFMHIKRDILAALFLSFAFIKPQYAMFLLLWPILQKRFRLFFYTYAWTSLLLGLCILVFGFKAIVDYIGHVSQFEVIVNTHHGMYCIRSLLEMFLPSHVVYGYSVFLFAFSFLCFWIIYFLKIENCLESGRWVLSVLIIAALLFSPHTFVYDQLLLIVPAVLTLPFTEKNQQSRSLKLWRAIFYILPIFSWPCFGLLCAHLPGNIIFIGVISVLFVCGLIQVFEYREAKIVSL